MATSRSAPEVGSVLPLPLPAQMAQDEKRMSIEAMKCNVLDHYSSRINQVRAPEDN